MIVVAEYDPVWPRRFEQFQAGAIAANIGEYGRAKNAMVQKILAADEVPPPPNM